MPERLLQSEYYILLTKILFPAFLAVGIKLAVEMKKTKTKISIFNISLSMIIGVGGAYLSSHLVRSNFSEESVPAIIALVAITSDKIGEFLIYKLNIDLFLTSLFDGFFQYISDMFNRKK